MSVPLKDVEQALKERKWELAADLAAQALAERKWSARREASLQYARSYSLSRLGRYSEALEPGQRAVFLAETSEDWDCLGLSLLILAFIQNKLPHGAPLAVATQQRYFQHFDRYKEAKNRYLNALLNLGNYLKAAGDHEAALLQFIQARDAAAKRQATDEADIARRNAVAEAFFLDRIDLAAKLIGEGQDHIKRVEAELQGLSTQDRNSVSRRNTLEQVVASHLLDVATLHEKRAEFDASLGKALEAIARAKDVPDLRSQGFGIIHRIAKLRGKTKGAIAAAVLAMMEANRADRYDLVTPAQKSLTTLGLREPDAVKQFIAGTTGIRREKLNGGH